MDMRYTSSVVVALSIPISHLQLPLPPGHLSATAIADSRLLSELVDIDIALFCPLQHQMASEKMGMLERGIRTFRLMARRELEERETACAMVELAG